LLVFNNHVGGLTSGGLSQTDTGNLGSIGGIAREFYRRVGQRYGAAERFLFEPHIAEQVFNAMLAEAGVAVYTNQRLASVTMSGPRITSISM
ncbi:FAD-dependent oxidoreductase, partial [Klebsiella pneumoniae]|uniref:FAD-dependent oxidoreductase n=1 Tax=Klebsiella pneumoniae TaxID=573 RepID=UPI00226E2035